MLFPFLLFSSQHSGTSFTTFFPTATICYISLPFLPPSLSPSLPSFRPFFHSVGLLKIKYLFLSSWCNNDLSFQWLDMKFSDLLNFPKHRLYKRVMVYWICIFLFRFSKTAGQNYLMFLTRGCLTPVFLSYRRIQTLCSHSSFASEYGIVTQESPTHI